MEGYIGEIRMFAGTFAPRNWALCDGQLLQINNYQALFAILGTTYGGDGHTTFALPDLRGRTAVHEGQGPGLPRRTLGERGGGNVVKKGTGGDDIQTLPYGCVNYMICVSGIFPSRD